MPVVTIRAAAWRQVLAKLKLGISSGINIHYLEKTPYAEYYTGVTVPLQLGADVQLFKINSNHLIETEVMSGFDFKKQSSLGFVERGGSISTFALGLNCKNSLLLKLSYELQFDKFSEEVIRWNNNIKPETVVNNVNRNTIFISLSTQF